MSTKTNDALIAAGERMAALIERLDIPDRAQSIEADAAWNDWGRVLLDHQAEQALDRVHPPSDVDEDLETSNMIAHRIARESAWSMIESHSLSVSRNGEDWQDMSTVEESDYDAMTEALAYFALQGDLIWHPLNERLARINRRAEPIDPTTDRAHKPSGLAAEGQAND